MLYKSCLFTYGMFSLVELESVRIGSTGNIGGGGIWLMDKGWNGGGGGGLLCEFKALSELWKDIEKVSGTRNVGVLIIKWNDTWFYIRYISRGLIWNKERKTSR